MKYDKLNDLLSDRIKGDEYREQLADLRDAINDLSYQIETLSPKLKEIMPFDAYDCVDTMQALINDIDEKFQL